MQEGHEDYQETFESEVDRWLVAESLWTMEKVKKRNRKKKTVGMQ